MDVLTISWGWFGGNAVASTPPDPTFDLAGLIISPGRTGALLAPRNSGTITAPGTTGTIQSDRRPT